MRDDLEQLPPLSDAGRDRRESILSAAKIHAHGRRTRRIVTRTAAGVILVFATVGAVLWQLRSTSSSIEAPPVPEIAHQDASAINPEPPTTPPTTQEKPKAAYQHFAFAMIHTNDSIASSILIKTKPENVARLSDDQLLDSLHRLGVDAGLATVGSQAQLVLNDTFKVSATP